MTVSAREEDRIVRRDLVEISAGRKCGGFQNVSIQPRPVTHLSARLRDPLLHFGEEIFARIGPFQIQSHLALANSENVAMRIGEAGHDCLAGEIDHARFVASEFSASAFAPTKTMRSPFTATASACGCFSLTV